MFKKLSRKLYEAKESFVISKRLLVLVWDFDKKLFLSHSAATAIPAIIPFINAYIYKLIIDLILSGLNKSFNYQTLYMLLGARFITLLTQYIAFSIQTFTETMFWSKVPIRLYQLVLGKVSSLDVEYVESASFRDTLQKVKESYAWMPLNLLSNAFYTFQSALQLSIAFVALATLNILIAVGIIIAALPAFVNQLYYSKTLWGVWSEHSPHRKRFFYLSELIQNKNGIKEMKIFGTAKKFLAQILGIQENLARENLSIGKRRLRNSVILNIFGTFIYISIEAFIALLTIAGKITIGSLSYFTFVIWNFESGVSGLFSNLNRVFSQSLYVKDIFKVLDTPTKITISEKAVKINTAKPPIIEFKNVSFSYPEDPKLVLKNFSLKIEPGEKIAFVGENGAGKTTIIKLLARFYDVTHGEILINGASIKNVDLETWYRTLGIIFQDFIKYEYTLGENIHFGKVYEKYNLDKIEKAASLSGINKVAREFDQGYKQMLGLTFKGGIELSLGQWQKVALARAFLRDAPILVLDEPTASIDAKAEKEIFDKVDRLSRDKTVIAISHRFSTVRNADTIYVIDKGRIVESGSHRQLIDANGMYAKLFKIQAERYK